MKRACIVVVTITLGSPVAADPPLVIPPDDGRTHAVASRKSIAFSSWYASLPDDNHALWFQAGIGPIGWRIPRRGTSVGWRERWTARVRGGMFVPGTDDQTTAAAPLTLAVQRIAMNDLADTPLFHVQTGLEIAVSTPWLSNRALDPTQLGAGVYTADTELVENGWSLRPASWHVRADLLVCRSIHAEAGVGPELFESTEDPERGMDLGLRWHASLGFSLACPGLSSWPMSKTTVVVQYRARALLYNRDPDRDPFYRDRMLFGIEYRPVHWFAIAGFMTPDREMFGVRFHVEAKGADR